MKNHNEKARDIARSVLPSTRRKSARDNAAIIKRRNRRKNNMIVHEWTTYDNPYDYEKFTTDYIYGWGENQNIKMNMWERRNGDKLSAIRWAERVCETKLKDMPAENRRGYFKSIFGDNLVGRHIISHLDSANIIPYDNPYEYGWRVRYEQREERAARIAAEKDADRGNVTRLVNYHHKHLNDMLRKHGFDPIHNIHDVDSFVKSLDVPASKFDPMTRRKIIENM